ncbi:MAG: lamin tail domain-containing protein, partial [Gammaproteobacteria bacterium]|nr:lamin tail domain-containing protein [Gammaproteobacteria bacterium]
MKKSTPLGSLSAAIILIFTSTATLSQAATRTPVAGDLVISEVMANPDAVSDTTGEWFEVYNLSHDSLIIDGLLISDNGSNQHLVDTGNSILIAPDEYFVFGRSADSSLNGGYTANYMFSNFTLSNTIDAIILAFGDTEITRLEYESGFGVAGNSMELIGLPSIISNYQLTPDNYIYGLGDKGTPGAMGSHDLNVSSVPVPAAVWLFGSGLLGMASLTRR